MTTPRKRIASCYDHLSGIAGQKLTDRLVDLGWVTPEPNPGVTPLGWKGFADLGLALTPLTFSRRKPVAFCTERRGANHFDHLGGHLGALVRQHFLEQGWLTAANGELALTPAGEELLQQLGVDLEGHQ
ncbi:MAG TPA: hypothetical protein VD969_15850 [Symbiobacteriaceae bacterium]|nr:hypothetical protein [Symbiobacteriaceae bacterium]